MSDIEVEGHVSVHPRGFGFISIPSGGPVDSAFVPPPELNPFFHGDKVRAHIHPGKDGRFVADHLQLVSRTRTRIFGTVTQHHRKPHLKTDRRVANTDWLLEGADGLEDGTPVVARVEDGRAVVMEVVSGAEIHLERLYARYGIRTRFSAEVEAELEALPEVPVGTRRDLRAIPTITIDEETSMDLDDALSVLPASPDGAIRALVHIADVDALVPEGSALDAEARARATSVYLEGAVIPMLPRALSENRLSLLPGQDRPTITAELRIDPEGVVTSVDLYPSLIRSNARLSYRRVADFLEQGVTEGLDEAVEGVLRWLRAATARIAVVRAGRGGVEIERQDASIVIDEKTREPSRVVPRGEDSAHLLIERMMVAANEAVAQWLVARGLPGIYRVHPEPDDSRIKALVDSAKTFGFEAGLTTPVTPKAMAAFEAQFRRTAAHATLSKIMSRVLGPAHYTVHPSAHFGLAAPLYLHFTSPIRRYADLMVHRVVKAFLDGRRDMYAGDQSFEDLAQHLTDRSIQAGKAERERFGVLAARLFGTKVGERHAGRVVGIKTYGLVVQLLGSGVTGTLASEDLPGGPWRVDRARHRLEGKGQAYALGDEVAVEIASTDESLGRIELKLLVPA